MGSKRKVQLQSGLLLVDKPKGVTSHDMVDAARRALHMKRVGHAGTLDPMATGLLIIGFGNGTRLLPYITKDRKAYEATIRLGQATTTEDAEGEITATTDASGMSEETIQQTIVEHLTGRINQVPSSFSAIKINGRHAYDLAREGEDVQLEPRRIFIESFEVREVRDAVADDGTPLKDVDVRVSCSAGTYIRALARDLGQLLGVGGHLTMLRRTSIGKIYLGGLHYVTAHVENRTFTNRDGETVTRAKAVFDLPDDEVCEKTIDTSKAASKTVGLFDISPEDGRDLRMGRRIHVRRGMKNIAAAYVLEDNDVVAIVKRVKGTDEMQPITVFAKESDSESR